MGLQRDGRVDARGHVSGCPGSLWPCMVTLSSRLLDCCILRFTSNILFDPPSKPMADMVSIFLDWNLDSCCLCAGNHRARDPGEDIRSNFYQCWSWNMRDSFHAPG